MKCSFVDIQCLALFLTCITLCTLSRCNQNIQAVSYQENEAKFFARYAKLITCADKPLPQVCPECIKPGDGYRFYYYAHITRFRKVKYKIMLHYNDKEKKVSVTFAGPDANSHHYIHLLYSKGFAFISKYKIKIEKEFAFMYFRKIRKILISKIIMLNRKGKSNYQFVFSGYSLGGSIATLAAFDLAEMKIVKNPIVYTYGAFRIGDASFVTLVNSSVKVFRIVKSDDFIVRIPNCYFSFGQKIWKCINPTNVVKFWKYSLRDYAKNYISLYQKSNLLLKKALTGKRMKVEPKQSKNGKKISKKRKQMQNKKYKKGIKQLIKMFKTKNYKALKKLFENPKTFILFKGIPNNKIISIIEKLMYKHIFPRYKAKLTFTRLKPIALKTLSNLFKRQIKPKKGGKDKARKKKIIPRAQIQKKVTIPSGQQPIANSRLYRAKLSEIHKLKPIQVYLKFIYYSQPIGYEIYYNNLMTSYTTCEYIDGISSCEKSVRLPKEFKAEAHWSYFNMRFDLCKKKKKQQVCYNKCGKQTRRRKVARILYYFLKRLTIK